jgi:hypothetical protein
MTADARVRTPARRPGRRPAPLALALVAAALAPAVTTAAPITATTSPVTMSIPVTPTNWSPGFHASLNDPLKLPRFDPSIGTLKSVNISLSSDVQNDFSMSFTAPSVITIGATGTRVALDLPNGTQILSATVPDVTRTSTVSGPPFPRDVTFPTLTRTATAGPVTLTSAADLAMFTALKSGDTIALPALATAQSTFTSSTGNGTGRVTTRAGADVTISYTYTPAVHPVPEPTSLVVVGAGVLVLVTSRRSRGR